jgi:NAD(P)-dependent dehydrogenase (short-subunit alcohol dehydrogenase family)
MDLGLHGKVAAITGGSEGIGRAAALRFCEEGARVAICARREEVLRKTALEIASATGGEVLAVQADVTTAADCDRFVQRTIERFGRLDILVNSAGCSAAMPFETADDEVWRQDIEVKLSGAMRCARLAIPYMRQRGGGRIINLTTIGGEQPGARSVPSSVTRAADIHLTKALAREYAADNILVNTICLGRLKSAQWTRYWQAQGSQMTLDEFYARQGESIPLKRLGEAEDVADLVCFLASERARYITGTAIKIDGGISGTVEGEKP